MPLTPLFSNPGTPATPAGSVATTDGVAGSQVPETSLGILNNSGTIDRLLSTIDSLGRAGSLLITDRTLEQMLSQMMQLMQAQLLAVTATNALLAQIVGPNWLNARATNPSLKNADELEANDLVVRALKIQGPIGAPNIGGLENDQNTLQ